MVNRTEQGSARGTASPSDHAADAAAIPRLLRWRDVQARVGLSRSSIFRLERSGRFPKRVPIGANSKGWFEHEITHWVLSRRVELPPASNR